VANYCFTTVVSPNHYSWFVPIFVYSINRAYPDAFVEVFVTGNLDPALKVLLAACHNYKIHENIFADYTVLPSTHNTLRFLVPQSYFKDYDYVIIRDVDFITFAHDPSHLKYYKKIMKAGRIPYAGQGGARVRPKAKFTKRWIGKYERVALGTLLLKQPDFWEKCGDYLDGYRLHVKSGEHDGFDGIKACSYQTYDEVAFCRVLKLAGLPTPKRRGVDPNGRTVSSLFRDIHLGDFESYRICKSKILWKKLHQKNVTAFRLLEKDPVWQQIAMGCCENGKIMNVINRLRKHAGKRK
jgi:hypothetical protein